MKFRPDERPPMTGVERLEAQSKLREEAREAIRAATYNLEAALKCHTTPTAGFRCLVALADMLDEYEGEDDIECLRDALAEYQPRVTNEPQANNLLAQAIGNVALALECCAEAREVVKED